jgi:hypothetical protein
MLKFLRQNVKQNCVQVTSCTDGSRLLWFKFSTVNANSGYDNFMGHN